MTHNFEQSTNRSFQRLYDWYLCKERHFVENFFLKLKHFHHLATRFDKLAPSFAGFVCLVFILIWIKQINRYFFQTLPLVKSFISSDRLLMKYRVSFDSAPLLTKRYNTAKFRFPTITAFIFAPTSKITAMILSQNIIITIPAILP